MEMSQAMEMANDVESSDSEPKAAPRTADRRGPASDGWLRVGAVAAASAALGGLAAAWFYRKTLSRLREAVNDIPDYYT